MIDWFERECWPLTSSNNTEFETTRTPVMFVIQTLRNLRSDRRGVTAVEYGLIAALVAAVIAVAITALGTTLASTISAVTGDL
jgi:pilus assembly protein Flp/PilA